MALLALLAVCGCSTQPGQRPATVPLGSTDLAGGLQARNLSPRDELHRVVYLQNHFVAIGGKGVLISPDANQWSGFSAAEAGTLRGGDFGNGVSVLVGDRTVASSRDLRSWRLLPSPSAFADVAFGQGHFVAVGDAGAVFRSSDGLSWVPQNSGSDVHLSDVIFSQGLFVAVGDGGTILTSPDGASWIRESTPSGDNLLAVCQAGAELLAVGTQGTMWASADGHGWAVRNAGTRQGLHGASAGVGIQVVVGGDERGLVVTASDGIHWSTQPLQPRGLNSLVFGGGTFVAVGRAGDIRRSSEGRSWQPCSPGTTPQKSLSDLAQVGGEVVAVGQSGTVLRSSDGIQWTEQASGVDKDLNDVDSSPERTVAVGAQGTILASVGSGNWSPVRSPVQTDLLEVHYHQGLWLAVGEQGTLLTSPDGLDWTLLPTGTSNYLCAAASSGSLSAVAGQGGTILLSRDGSKSWAPVASGSNATLVDMSYAEGKFLAVGHGGAILASRDGLSWSRRNSGTDRTLFDVAFGQGRWLAVGQSGVAVTSVDGGITWSEVAPVSDNGLSGVMARLDRFLAVGLHGQVVEFGPAQGRRLEASSQ